jgi:hypothetical protein
VSSSSSISSLHSASDSGAVEEGSDTEVSIAPEELVPPVATETVREVYLISDEDAREHEDAVELVNWSTFEEWKQPWHIVKLWEGSVYDEMTLWGSIPLQNDKLRKVLLGLFTFNGRLYLSRCVNIPNVFDNTGSGMLMLFL